MAAGTPRDERVLAGEADEPMEMLSRLHASTLEQCEGLRQLSGRLAECGCDPQSRLAAGTLLRHFDVVPAQYHSDEEDDLFPALLEAMAGSDAVCLRDLTSAMTRQHRQLETMWGRLRESLGAVANGQDALLDAAEVEDFVELNRSHIACEQSELLPMASRLLTDDAMAQVWKSMSERRRA